MKGIPVRACGRRRCGGGAARRRARRRLPRWRHEPGRPHEARRRRPPTCSSTSGELTSSEITDLPDGGLRIGAGVPQRRPRRRPARPRTVPACSRRRCWPAPPAAPQPGDHRRQPAPAHPLRLLHRRHHAVQQARAGQRAARRSRGCTATTRSSASLRRHCVATHPSDMAVAMVALDAVVRVLGPDGERDASRSPTCTGCPATTRDRDTTLRHGDLITAIDCPPAWPCPRGTARPATAPRSPSPSSSVAAALEVEDGVVGDVRLALGRSGAQAVARDRPPRRRCAAARHRGVVRGRRRRRARRGHTAARQPVQGAAGAQPRRPHLARPRRARPHGDDR